jgi:Zn-dependent protease
MLFIEYLSKDPLFFFAWILSIVVSICLHELAHGVVAVWLGDDTPIELERITLNPLVHMGPVSLICLLFAGISWGAMPVDNSRLRWRYGPALVAIAGPVTNLLLAVLCLVGLGIWTRYSPRPSSQAVENARFLLQICGEGNVLLAMFNLIPFPPLDGAHILENFSTGFRNLVARLSPTFYIQAALLLFIVAGAVLWNPAMRVSAGLFSLGYGH